MPTDPTESPLTIPDAMASLSRVAPEGPDTLVTSKWLPGEEARFRAVLDRLSEAVVLLDAEGAVVHASGSAVKVLGHPPGELLAHPESGLVHPDDRDLVAQLFQQALARPGEECGTEYRRRHTDGSWRAIQATALNRLAEPAVRAVVLSFRDVTGHRRAEEALRASEARSRTVIDNLEQYIFLKDTEYRFVAGNPPFVRSLGCHTEAEIIGRRDEDFFPPELVAKYRADDRRVLEEGTRLEVEEQYLMGGQMRTIRTVKTPLRDGGGRTVGVLGIFWDVTEQRLLEAQLRQSQKMDAVGQLAGGIAHDFNNLLTAILGNLALVLDGLPADDPSRDLLATAEKAAQRAANLTGQLLGFSRRTVLRTEEINLNTAIEEVLSILCRTIDPRVLLEVRRAPDLWTVQADPGQVNQVLLNLCLNARDAMPDGGRLHLETQNIVLDDRYARLHLDGRAGEFVRLRVSDTGTGIPPEVRARIFEPFFTTKEPGKGTGLGLAMVFGIVKQHQGWIDCYSEVGQGTRFDVYLPRGRPGSAAPLRRATKPPGRGHETILLADDEAMIRKLGQAILRHYGYEVLLAEDGEQAVELYAQHRADIALVILDLTMPRLSGRDAFRRLRELDPEVRVLFASGYSAEHLAEEDHRRACGFVGKPYRPEDLARTVRAVLDRAS